MSNRKDFSFRQRVSESELDGAFDDLEQADHALAAGLGFFGVVANAVVSQHAPVPDLTVDVSGPGAAIDQIGQRVFFSALQNVNVAQDSNGVSTAVSAPGQEKIVSIFVKFDRALSDPRVDGNSQTVFFRREESFKFIVAQGAEGPTGTALPPPLRADAVLLADITRAFGQVQILNGAISSARRQEAFAVAGNPRAIRRGRPIDAIADLLGFYNAHASGTADRHPASAVDAPATGVLPAGTVAAQIATLEASKARVFATNVFTAPQTVNGAAGDLSPTLQTTVPPNTRKLLWEIASSDYKVRLYVTTIDLEMTFNARWEGTEWAKDNRLFTAARFVFGPFDLRYERQSDDSVERFDDFADWNGRFILNPNPDDLEFLDSRGFVAPGFTESYAAWQGVAPPAANRNIASGCSFKKGFPAEPSSITFEMLDSENIEDGPFPFAPTEHGTGVFCSARTPGVNARFYTRVFAS